MAGRRTHITQADHARITAAIKHAETRTDGEIFAVVAHESDSYGFVATAFAATWSLVFGLLCGVVLSWQGLVYGPLWVPLAQCIAFAAIMVCLIVFPAFRMALVPRSVTRKRASNNAVRQFLAHNIHTTQHRSGVLLFISLAERHAEVVADEGIDRHVDQSEWDAMVEMLTDGAKSGHVAEGFVAAIEAAGELLATHFPSTPGEKNELDDRLVEL